MRACLVLQGFLPQETRGSVMMFGNAVKEAK